VSLSGNQDLLRAFDFAVSRSTRIVAAIPGGLLFTDDLGQRWQPIRWDYSASPHAIAFDLNTDFGVAVGENGSVWTTDDGALTWRSRRDDAGIDLIRVCVLGRIVAIGSSEGSVWISADGGTSVRLVVRGDSTTGGSIPSIAIEGHAIRIRRNLHEQWRVGSDGVVELETEPAP
jgi:photosystem II stability/assembly factor-like uncharacterized protein